MSDERKAFVDILTKDRFDAKTRLVFADWLEEHGCDDEAAEQRRMASPEWVEAAKWIEEQVKATDHTCTTC